VGTTYVFRDVNTSGGGVQPNKIGMLLATALVKLAPLGKDKFILSYHVVLISVERRHFNDLVKILKKDVLKWKSFYEALGLEQVIMFSTTNKLLKNEIQPAEAYRDALDAWKEEAGRDATFGVLDDILRNQIDWAEAAGMHIFNLQSCLVFMSMIFHA